MLCATMSGTLEVADQCLLVLESFATARLGTHECIAVLAPVLTSPPIGMTWMIGIEPCADIDSWGSGILKLLAWRMLGGGCAREELFVRSPSRNWGNRLLAGLREVTRVRS